MTAALRTLLLVAVIVISVQPTSAQQSNSVTLTEPGVINLASLFKQADTVALVKIVSGDTENYDVAVYKGVVVSSFKGTATGDTLYFGPYRGDRLGWEYVLFLRKVAKPIAPKTNSSANYGTISYAEVFNEGYSSMMTSYECVFDGKETAQQCDYGVRVCTDYILLPKSTRTFPPVTESTPFGCSWVRKPAFMSLLSSLASSKK
jgi:hypothetical protein